MITVGYAALKNKLNITGTSKLDDNIKWDVHFKEESAKVTDGSVTSTVPTIDTNKNTVMYSIDLSKPKDFYEFTVDVVNVGSIDAMLNEITKATLEGATAAAQEYINKYIDYTVTYEDGIELNKGGNKDLLVARTGKETLKVRVAMKDVDSLPTPKNLTFKLQLNYIQADSTAKEREKIKLCKRATTLHTETCNNSESSYYCQGDGYQIGDTVTYGNLGSGNTLTSGDAFDCDVNGDGVYSSTTERFYYVSDYYDTETNTFDDTKVTLIYYNNVSSGIPDNTKTYAYDLSNENWHGPITLAPQLPTITQWANEKIINPGSTRQIRNALGTTTTIGGTLPKFDYSNYAARLLTAQELNKGCNVTYENRKRGDLTSKCTYLLENTEYTGPIDNSKRRYWLETPSNSKETYAFDIHAYERTINQMEVISKVDCGVRPVIIALKSDILS